MPQQQTSIQQTSEQQLQHLKSMALAGAAYLKWPEFNPLNIDAGEQNWARAVASMTTAPLVRLLIALVTQIDTSESAGSGVDMARQGDTQAGGKQPSV